MMFDIGTLYDDFLSKIKSMSREELFESARLAEESSRYAHKLDNGYFDAEWTGFGNTKVQSFSSPDGSMFGFGSNQLKCGQEYSSGEYLYRNGGVAA